MLAADILPCQRLHLNLAYSFRASSTQNTDAKMAGHNPYAGKSATYHRGFA